jgi:hypothetical protein
MQKGALVHGKVACNSQTLVRALTKNSKRGPSGASRQAAALRREGVQIERGTLGEYMVDFSIYGWYVVYWTLQSEVPCSSKADKKLPPQVSRHASE